MKTTPHVAFVLAFLGLVVISGCGRPYGESQPGPQPAPTGDFVQAQPSVSEGRFDSDAPFEDYESGVAWLSVARPLTRSHETTDEELAELIRGILVFELKFREQALVDWTSGVGTLEVASQTRGELVSQVTVEFYSEIHYMDDSGIDWESGAMRAVAETLNAVGSSDTHRVALRYAREMLAASDGCSEVDDELVTLVQHNPEADVEFVGGLLTCLVAPNLGRVEDVFAHAGNYLLACCRCDQDVIAMVEEHSALGTGVNLTRAVILLREHEDGTPCPDPASAP